jgi:hypothetical protein
MRQATGSACGREGSSRHISELRFSPGGVCETPLASAVRARRRAANPPPLTDNLVWSASRSRARIESRSFARTPPGPLSAAHIRAPPHAGLSHAPRENDKYATTRIARTPSRAVAAVNDGRAQYAPVRAQSCHQRLPRRFSEQRTHRDSKPPVLRVILEAIPWLQIVKSNASSQPPQTPGTTGEISYGRIRSRRAFQSVASAQCKSDAQLLDVLDLWRVQKIDRSRNIARRHSPFGGR